MKRNCNKKLFDQETEKKWQDVGEKEKDLKKQGEDFEKQETQQKVRSGTKKNKNGKAKKRWNLLKIMLLAFRSKHHTSKKVNSMKLKIYFCLCIQKGSEKKELFRGEEGRLSFLGRRYSFKVNIYLKLNLRNISLFQRRDTNLSLVTQHPDSTQDIVEMAREDTEDEDEDDIWLTEENKTNSVENEFKEMGI